MPDQAAQLRQLVLRAARQRSDDALPPRIIGVLGARTGLGVTTAAALLGRALVEQGSRVVLVDADVRQRSLARTCGLEVPASYRPATAREDIHEAILRAPGGLQLVPGVWDSPSVDEKTAQSLLRQFGQLGRHADWLVLDLGVPPAILLRMWSAAIESLLIVTAASQNGALETYTLIKQSLVSMAGRGVELLVNQTSNQHAADDVFARVDRSCRKFLGFGVRLAGFVPPGVAAADLSEIAARLCNGSSARGEHRAA
jgi:flagellar biosynthesis protein FlhG